MKYVIVYSLLVCCSFLSANVSADHGDKGSLDKCLKVVKSIKSGVVGRAEYHNYSHEGEPAYEIEIIDSKGREWEFECNKKGYIVELEQEVKSASDPLFKKRMKVSEDEAKKTVLEIYPGKVEKVEYEIEFDGSPSYEFNIEDSDGTEFNVEVNAETGAIIEVSTEGWEIGVDE